MTQHYERLEMADHLANLITIHQHFYDLGGSHEHHQWLTREMHRTVVVLQAECEKRDDQNNATDRSALQPGARGPADGPAQANGDQSSGHESAGEDGAPGNEA
jgi:hypothetical protein